MSHTNAIEFLEIMPTEFLSLDFSFADEDIFGQKSSQVDDELWGGDWRMGI